MQRSRNEEGQKESGEAQRMEDGLEGVLSLSRGGMGVQHTLAAITVKWPPLF